MATPAMERRHFQGVCAGALLVAANLLVAQRASADAPAMRSVWIEVRPWTCVHESRALARDIELACDALRGGCRVAESEGAASHRAVLTCESAERWTLRTESADGRLLYSVVLDGDREQRLRKAAMWVARAEDDGPMPPSSPPAAAAPPPAPIEPATIPEERADGQPDRAPPKTPAKTASGGLVLDAEIGVTNSSHADSLHGLHGAILYDVGPLRLGPAASLSQLFETNSGFGSGVHSADVRTVGLRVGWGAPFTDSIVGVWLEGGFAWGDRYGRSINPDLASDHAHFVSASGRADVLLQVPLRGSVRPYLYAAGVQTFGQFDESVQSAIAGAGVAWRAW